MRENVEKPAVGQKGLRKPVIWRSDVASVTPNTMGRSHKYVRKYSHAERIRGERTRNVEESGVIPFEEKKVEMRANRGGRILGSERMRRVC